jgi:hypothetical protein
MGIILYLRVRNARSLLAHIKRIRRGACQLGLLRAAFLFSRPACEITGVTGE